MAVKVLWDQSKPFVCSDNISNILVFYIRECMMKKIQATQKSELPDKKPGGLHLNILNSNCSFELNQIALSVTAEAAVMIWVKIYSLTKQTNKKKTSISSALRHVTTFGVGSWRPSGRWWLVTPCWCWSPFTCTSSEVCLGCSGRSWACQRKGEFLWVFKSFFFFLISSEQQTWHVLFIKISLHLFDLSDFVTWVWNVTTQWNYLHVSFSLLHSYWPVSCSCTTSTLTFWLLLTSTMYPSGRRQGERTANEYVYSNKIAPALWSKATNKIISRVC